MLLVAGALQSASAQTGSANRSKLKECRKEVKAKSLAGDDRWFYIEDCVGRS